MTYKFQVFHKGKWKPSGFGTVKSKLAADSDIKQLNRMNKGVKYRVVKSKRRRTNSNHTGFNPFGFGLRFA